MGPFLNYMLKIVDFFHEGLYAFFMEIHSKYCLYLQIRLEFFNYVLTRIIFNFYKPVLKFWSICACATHDFVLMHNIYKFPSRYMLETYIGNLLIIGVYKWIDEYMVTWLFLKILSGLYFLAGNFSLHTRHQVEVWT